jgi:hypothetical protein
MIIFLLLPFAETELTGFSWTLEVWEEPVVEWFFFVPFSFLVVPVGSQTSNVTSVDLETSFDPFSKKMWVAVVFRVFVTFSPEQDSQDQTGKADVQENDSGVELPSISWLLISVVSVFEVTVVKSVDLFSTHFAPVTLCHFSQSVQFWILVGEFWGLWKWDQETLVVIVVSVWVLKKLFVLLDRHHVSWVVDVIFFDRGGGNTSESQSTAHAHAADHDSI